jgi:hypothetical protein
MLIEIWERLRGYDKWTRAEATVKSSKVARLRVGWPRIGGSSQRGRVGRWQSNCIIDWADVSGKLHTTRFAVAERSPLFQLLDGQTVSILYNPADPGEYYLRELFRHRMSFALTYGFFFLFEGFLFIHFALRIWRHLY